MEFRQPDIAGTFVHHCHILEHEDKGMMAKIELVWDPKTAARTAALIKSGGMRAVLAEEKGARNRAAESTVGLDSGFIGFFRKLASVRTSALEGGLLGLLRQAKEPLGDICTSQPARGSIVMEKIH